MGGRRADAAIFADAPVQDLDLSRQRRGQGAVVGDDHDGGSLAVQVLQQAEDGGSGGAVEIAGGFIGQDDGGVADQGPRDARPLAFPSGQLGGFGVGAVGEPDSHQRLVRLFAAGPDGMACCMQAIGHVVECGLMLGQEELLEHESDGCGPQGGDLPVGEPADIEPADPDGPRGRPGQRAHDVQQSRLA